MFEIVGVVKTQSTGDERNIISDRVSGVIKDLHPDVFPQAVLRSSLPLADVSSSVNAQR